MASSIRAPHSSLLSTTSEEAYRPIRELIEKPILSGSYILLARRRWSANATWAGKDSRCKSICYIKTALYSSKKKYKIIYRPEKKLEITFDLFSAWTSPGLQDKDADLFWLLITPASNGPMQEALSFCPYASLLQPAV